MLTALMDGRALTVSELALAAGVALPTASGHLTRLEAAGLTLARKQGRHRYIALAGAEVADALEALMALADRTGARRVRTGPRDPQLREARICYDHLAGARAVAMLQSFVARGLVADADAPGLTDAGHAAMAAVGIDLSALRHGRRPLCRACLDWSERKSHLGGQLGAAILDHALHRQWARRAEGRVIAVSARGARAFDATFVVPA